MSIERLLTILSRFKSRQTARGKPAALPAVFILSDTARGYDIESQLAVWPMGFGFIERTFGRVPYAKHGTDALRLATCAYREARVGGLDGVHWPQSRLSYRRKSAAAGLIETSSAHSGLAIGRAIQLGLSVILVSTVFSSDSPSAKRPLGPIRLAKLQRTFPTAQLYALGGVTVKTAKKLSRTQVHGVAFVSFKEIQ
jgi:thiamine-phosphate pyrophosphorylase